MPANLHNTVYADVIHAEPLQLPTPAPIIAQGWLMQAAIASELCYLSVVKPSLRNSVLHLGYNGPEGHLDRYPVPNGWLRVRTRGHAQLDGAIAHLVEHFEAAGVTPHGLATMLQFPVRRWGRQALYMLPMAGTPYHICMLVCCDQPARGGFTNPVMFAYAAQPDAEWLAQAAQGVTRVRSSHKGRGGARNDRNRMHNLWTGAQQTEWFWGDGTPVDAGVVLWRMLLGLGEPAPEEPPMHAPPQGIETAYRG